MRSETLRNAGARPSDGKNRGLVMTMGEWKCTAHRSKVHTITHTIETQGKAMILMVERGWYDYFGYNLAALAKHTKIVY